MLEELEFELAARTCVDWRLLDVELAVEGAGFADDDDDEAECAVTLARREPDRYGAGSVGRPFTRVSKCTCGPVASPVVPTYPIT